MRFCPQCGAPLAFRVPPGDDRQRAVCDACGAVHYENPRPVVGCLVERGDALLLCRRAIEPARGRWTVPAGFLELGESAVAGALRETREEARAAVEVVALHAHLDLPHVGQSYLLYRARLVGAEPEAGPESLEVAWFPLDRLPFGELSFPVVDVALRLLLEDRGAGRRHLHHGCLRYLGEGSRFELASYRLEEHLRVPLPGAGGPA